MRWWDRVRFRLLGILYPDLDRLVREALLERLYAEVQAARAAAEAAEAKVQESRDRWLEAVERRPICR